MVAQQLENDMMKHTSGPWAVEVGDSDSDWPRQWPTIQAKDYEVVGTEGLYGDFETDIANARLIAAAPDLLEALQLILPMAKGYAHQYPVGSNQAYCDQAEAAIAKATGDQP